MQKTAKSNSFIETEMRYRLLMQKELANGDEFGRQFILYTVP